MKNILRHGDISFHPINKAEGEIIKHNGSFVLAEGETTGHKHVITTENIADMEVRRASDGGYILTLKKAGTISHEEHKTIIVPPGTYQVGKEREMDWFSLTTRKVID